LKHRLPPPNSLVVFEAAARLGSYTAAARELGITLAAVSRHVDRIESHLGAAVFKPQGRGRVLTLAGKDLHDAVTVGLEHIASAVARIRPPSQGRSLTIAAPLAFASLWLVPRMVAFRRQYPDIKFRFITADADLDPGEEGLALAVRYGHGNWPHLNVTPLLQPHVFPVCTPEFLQACEGLDSIDALLTQTLLDRETEDSFGIGWNTWLSRVGVSPHQVQNRITFNSYEIVLRAALAGHGVALGVDVLVEDLLQQGLLVAPLRDKVRWQEAYYLVSPRHASLSPELSLFSDWILGQAQQARTPP